MGKDYTTVLEDIAKRYHTGKLVYDDDSLPFVSSVCDFYIKYDKITMNQQRALVRITGRIERGGPKFNRKVTQIDIEGVGYLGCNMKTNDVWVHSWNIEEER